MKPGLTPLHFCVEHANNNIVSNIHNIIYIRDGPHKIFTLTIMTLKQIQLLNTHEMWKSITITQGHFNYNYTAHFKKIIWIYAHIAIFFNCQHLCIFLMSRLMIIIVFGNRFITRKKPSKNFKGVNYLGQLSI